LTKLSHTSIPLPKLSHVSVEAFQGNVVILPTKTKPKKIHLLGSDGKSYIYLFKGMEDLHLDQRIMQFLDIVNLFLQKDRSSQRKTRPFVTNKKQKTITSFFLLLFFFFSSFPFLVQVRSLRARNYAVVPLGTNAGMIEWVDDAIPLYTLYRKWQLRDAVARTQNPAEPVKADRPTEIFQEKVLAGLKDRHLPANLPRKNWPLQMLSTIFSEMVGMTPKDLLEKEFWTSSANPTAWWANMENFSRSLAVMSVIGVSSANLSPHHTHTC